MPGSAEVGVGSALIPFHGIMQNLIGTGHGQGPYLVAQRQFAMSRDFLGRSFAPDGSVGLCGFLFGAAEQITGIGIDRHTTSDDQAAILAWRVDASFNEDQFSIGGEWRTGCLPGIELIASNAVQLWRGFRPIS